MAPLAVSLICFIGAYASSRRKEPYAYRLVAGAMIMILANAEWHVAEIMSLMFGGFLCDAISSPKTTTAVKPVLIGLGIGAVMMLYRVVDMPQRIVLSPTGLAVQHRDVTTFERQKLRILEVTGAGERLWQIKDGKSLASVYAFEDYKDSHGVPVSAEDLVGRIEKWADIQREHFMVQPDGSLLRRPKS
jgi:hypothetical protein